MTDTFELEKYIRMNGLTKKAVADALGISVQGFLLKLNNITEFKASEISTVSDLLNMDQDDIQRIFFVKSVHDKQHD